MKPSVPLDGCTRTGKLALLGAVLLLLGCQSLIFDPRGHQVPEDKRITIPDSGEQAGVYKNEDLRVAYKMVRAPGQLRISGEIRFADRISESFPVIQYFNLGAMLLDGQGKILDMCQPHQCRLLQNPICNDSRLPSGLQHLACALGKHPVHRVQLHRQSIRPYRTGWRHDGFLGISRVLACCTAALSTQRSALLSMAEQPRFATSSPSRRLW